MSQPETLIIAPNCAGEMRAVVGVAEPHPLGPTGPGDPEIRITVDGEIGISGVPGSCCGAPVGPHSHPLGATGEHGSVGDPGRLLTQEEIDALPPREPEPKGDIGERGCCCGGFHGVIPDEVDAPVVVMGQ